MNNKAINEFCFRKIGRIKEISRPSASVDNTIPDLLNSSHPTQPHSLIAKYQTLTKGTPSSRVRITAA